MPFPLSRLSLALRLTLWYSAMAFVLLVGAEWAQYRSLAADLASEDDQLLVESLIVGRTTGVRPVTAPSSPAALGPFVRALNAQCRVVTGAIVNRGPPPNCGAATDSGAVLRSWNLDEGSHWRTATVRVNALPLAPEARWLEVVLDRRTDEEVLRNYRRVLGAVLLVTLLASAVLGYGIARRGLMPLRRLGAAMSQMDARSLDRPLNLPRSPVEIKQLGESLDDMRARLHRAFETLTQFSAELAHEFRTPLHVLRQQAEVALARARTSDDYRDVLGSSLEELERLRRMVDDILFLARAEDPRAQVQHESLRVATECAAVAGFMDALALEGGVTITVDVPDDLMLCADRVLVRRALVNVVTNAIRHTPAGGRVTLAATIADDLLAIEVRDTGAGVPSDVLPRVFDRYFRLPGADRGGDSTGLGLAIVRGIMQLHGGSATMCSSVGLGSSVVLLFPNSDAACSPMRVAASD